MTDQTEVKSSIKLRFRTKSGQHAVVIRSQQLTRKKTKLEYKALDGVIRLEDEDGKRVSTSVKCSDLNKEIPSMMGVSSAILENVIFCHQEDSNWPMMEGATLKQKFDDVFESTRYAKALEAFLKTKKTYSDKAKNLKGELMELGAHLQASKDTEKELDACKDNQEKNEEELNQIKDRLSLNEERIRNSRDTVQRLQSGALVVAELTRKIEDMTRQVAEKEKRLETVYNDDDAELKRRIENFDVEMKSREEEMRKLQREIDKSNQEIASLRETIDELNVSRGIGESLDSQRKETLKDLQQHVNATARKHSLTAPSIASSGGLASTREFVLSLKRKKDSLQSESEAALSQIRNKVGSYETEFIAVNSKAHQVEAEIENKKRELDATRTESERKRVELSSLASARVNVEQAERELEDARREYNETNASAQDAMNNCKAKLDECKKEIADITEAYARDADLLRDLSKNRSEFAHLDAYEKQLNTEKVQLGVESSSLVQSNRDLFPSGPIEPQSPDDLDPLIATLSSTINSDKRELNMSKEALMSATSESAATEALLSQKKDLLASVNVKLKELRQSNEPNIAEIVRCTNEVRLHVEGDLELDVASVIDSIPELKNKITEVQKCLSLLTAYVSCSNGVQKRIQKIEQKVPNDSCMCCGRKIDSEEVREKYNKVRGRIYNIASPRNDAFKTQMNGEEYEKLLDDYRVQVEKFDESQKMMAQVPSLLQTVEESKEVIEELEAKKSTLADVIKRNKDRIAALEGSLPKLERVAKELSQLSSTWKSHIEKMKDFQEKKRRQSQSMSFYDCGGRSLEAIEEEQARRNERKDELQAKKDRLLAEESRFLQKHSQIKIRLAEKERLHTEALQRGNRYSEVEKQQKDLLSKIENLEDRKRSLLLEREEMARQKGDRENLLNDAKADLKQSTDAAHEKIAGISADIDNLGRLIENLEGITARCDKTNLTMISNNLENAQVTIAQKEEIIKTNAPKITALNSDLSSRSKFKRIVEDNMELREMKKEVEKLRIKLKELQDAPGIGSRLAGGSAEEQLQRAQRDLQKYEHDRSKLTSERDRLIGHMEIYEKQATDLMNKLKTPVYKNVEERYRVKSIEYETTLMAVADVTTYYEALDSALQNFHTLKIKEINKIIRELWMLIYKGQDIDTIELESGTENPTSGRTSRSYNYRVVMRKGDTPLDMRGRCSAGQRVLASIVIRLALAETFCLHCGILTLDEPTTNLDEPNKTGLAHALSRIIINRKKQQNFQLICITHDEDFVRLMKNELSASPDFSMPENYFRVYREADDEMANKFFSKIERISWESM